ncbi:hypothetical protein Taro_051613 [Colocasia esculenta]|uniref:Uncharacterized protein n=1 Tax=Colocasia esculenta TaxID=4460 RepID=A0A843XGE9_COLES|nr:hypothetical protein [Colocasia esculenta]
MSQIGQSGSESSWRNGSGEGRRWSPRLSATRTTSGPMLGSMGPRCTRGPDDRLTPRDGSPRSRASSIPPSSSETTSKRAGPCAADGGRGFLLLRGSWPLRLGGPASVGGGPSGGRPAQLREREQELRTALARTTTLEAEMAELRLRPEVEEVARWRQEAEAAARWQQEAAEATRWRQEAEEAARLRAEAGDLRTQLGEERHRSDMLRSKMRGLERALALVGRSRSVTSRSGIPSGSAGHYLTGSFGRRRNEEEERRRRERAPEGSETGPRVMAPPSPRPPEGTGESG